MARVMLAWELGGGLGHAMRLAQLADRLLQRGHELHLVWKDLSVSHHCLGPLLDAPGLHLWQAPLWLPGVGGLPDAASHAELLFRAGYVDAAALLGPVRAWRGLFDAICPDLLLADYAPTALLAARGLGLCRALIGSGFLVPPARGPMPSFRDWEAVPAERIAAADTHALSTCNDVLAALGGPPLAALHELWRADEVFLLGWPELDHLAALRGTTPPRCWGALPNRPAGVLPAWPAASGQRIFGYLRRDHPDTDAVLARLRSGPWCCLVHVPGIAPDQAARLASPHLRISPKAVDMDAALAEAELLLCHAGAGSVYAALAAGVPAVMMPLQAEQLLLARRVVAAGAGVWLWPHEADAGLGAALSAVLGSTGFRRAARALADRNGPAVYGDVLTAITTRCEVLAEPPVAAQ